MLAIEEEEEASLTLMISHLYTKYDVYRMEYLISQYRVTWTVCSFLKVCVVFYSAFSMQHTKFSSSIGLHTSPWY